MTRIKTLVLVVVILSWTTNIFAQKQYASVLESSIWKTIPPNTISVCWDNPSPENKEMRDSVRAAVRNTWEKYSTIRFTEWCSASEKDCDVHIYINDERPYTNGRGVLIMNQPKGVTLNFTLEKWGRIFATNKLFWIKAIAVHEFGHVLGFAHEQNRPGCKFPHCEWEEPAQEGDWTTPCDSFSVMNYCNPKYANHGKLSRLDIQGVQSLYGAPQHTAEPDSSSILINSDTDGIPDSTEVIPTENSVQPFEIVYSSSFYKKSHRKNYDDWYELKIYIGANSQSDSIKNVVYHLHPTFSQPNMYVTNKKDNFGISLIIWGEFEISADIYLNNGRKFTTKKELKFLP